MADIGATLREARMRARIDVSEIEAQTKIRAKYLRALENEEWSLLPGPTFVRSFLRTYAEALGLDGKALVEEYRLHHERPNEAERADHGQHGAPSSSRPARAGNRSGGRTLGRSAGRASGSERGSSGRSSSRAYLAIVGAVCLVIALLIVGLLSDHGNGGGDTHTTQTNTTAGTAAKGHQHQSTHHKLATTKPAHAHKHRPAGRKPGSGYMTLALTPTEPVWVCLVGPAGHAMIAGETLEPGQTVKHRAKGHFEISLGNTALTMTLNNKALELPESGSPENFTITKNGLEMLETPPACT